MSTAAPAPVTAGDLMALRRRDIAVVLMLGLAQAVAIAGFLIMLIVTIDALALRPSSISVGPKSMTGRLVALAIIAVITGVIRGAEFAICERIGYRVVRDLRMRMYGHLQGMLPSQIQGRSRGGLVLRFVGDLSMLRTWISRGLLGGMVAVIVIIGATLVIMVLNVWLALTMIAVMAAGSAVSLAAGRPMRRATRTMRRRRSLLTSNIDEQMNVLPVVQVFGRNGGEFARLERQNESLNRSLVIVARLRGRLRGISTTSGLLVTVAVLAVGIVEVNAGKATIGLVVATMTVSRILNGPIRALGLAHDYWQRSRVSERKLVDYFNSASTASTDTGSARLTARRGRIEFTDVCVPGRLAGVTATAERGQLIAITGPGGAGKSTLLSIVARLVDPVSGSVSIDGQDLGSTRRFSAAGSVGFVSSDLPLMRGSLRRNLTYRHPKATADEVMRVMAQTGLDDVVADLPDGLDTWIIEGGRNLSVGQRQRVSLARALMGNPMVLLLDEPTANLDPATSSVIHDVIVRHQGTALLVSHDPNELALADQVWFMKDGVLTDVVAGEEYRDQLWRKTTQEGSWIRQPSS